MRTIQFTVAGGDAGRTVEQFLKANGVSRRVIIALKKSPTGLLRNGTHTRTVDRLSTGDVLEINLPATEKRMPPCATPVGVLYEDEDVLVYDKPANMPCHQSGGHIYDTLSGVWAARCAQTGMVTPFRAVNRLDMDTTGCLVAAKNQLAAGKLWKAVSKVYAAVAAGSLARDSGLIDLPIERESPYDIKRVVTPEGQRAVTRYEVLARDAAGGCTLAAFTLLTGRTHQIRVHMSHLGHPLLGDALYGGDVSEISRQALHCAGAVFPHVVTGERIVVLAPPPADFWGLLAAHGLPWPEDRITQMLLANLAGQEE